MSDDDHECEECEAGAPAWLATFADLMSLLMCFFVLLLSFSELDIQKYKQVAGSMKFAFGVQKQVKVDDIPKGTSVIKQEFSPGKPEPSVIKTMQQPSVNSGIPTVPTPNQAPERVRELLERVRLDLKTEIDADVLEVLPSEDGVMIRVRERDSFPSGSARLQAGFLPVLDKLVELFEESDGRIIVAGHTDDVPIATSNYPSNWVLSSARAAAVVHYLSTLELTDPSRIELRAYADTRPVVSNDSPENRARNRRVEINVRLSNRG